MSFPEKYSGRVRVLTINKEDIMKTKKVGSRFVPTIVMHRFEFHTRMSQGNILDVGCADAQGWTFPIPQESMPKTQWITGYTGFDCDEWEIVLPGGNFVRGNADNLPFEDGSFDTVCLGDILEHVKDPHKVLNEAMRVTKDRVVVTVPNEWLWDDPNLLSFETREKWKERGADLREVGRNSTIGHPSGKCKDAEDDVLFPHVHHVRFYNEETFVEFLDELQKGDFPDSNYYVFNLRYHAHDFYNLGALIFKM